MIWKYEQEQPYKVKNRLHLNYDSLSNIMQKHWRRNLFKGKFVWCLHNRCLLLLGILPFYCTFYTWSLHFMMYNLLFMPAKNAGNLHNKISHVNLSQYSINLFYWPILLIPVISKIALNFLWQSQWLFLDQYGSKYSIFTLKAVIMFTESWRFV